MDSILPKDTQHWLRRYGNKVAYQWRLIHSPNAGEYSFSRPLGLVESAFDSDGRYFEGRADVNVLLELQITSTLSRNDFRERILIAWTCLRCQHALLQARTIENGDEEGVAVKGMCFAADVAKSVGMAIEKAGKHLVFLEDWFGNGVDWREFYVHCMNVGRVVQPEEALGRVFVLPLREGMLGFVVVMGHEVTDGLSTNVWMRDFIRCLNEPEVVLRDRIADYIKPKSMRMRLPLPQEAIYQPIPGNLARQRWFWVITRVLRHVRTTLPTGFSNPLRRQEPNKTAAPFPPTFSPVLDYIKNPVLNTLPLPVRLSQSHTKRLHGLCKTVNATLGAGIYALSALVMMEFHQRRHPNDPKTFITGFPLNPRAFFNHHTDPDSCMLAFSDGIALPFLPADLDLEGRIRLLARIAQRQLASYQKRAKAEGHDATRQYLTSRGAGLILANQYLVSLERAHANLPAELRQDASAQGEYPARMNPTMQTCGVSSIGNREHILKPGTYDLSDRSRDFVADFHNLSASVRARPGEFLLGIAGDSRGLFATPSIDISTMNPTLVEEWRERFETILEEIQHHDPRL